MGHHADVERSLSQVELVVGPGLLETLVPECGG
jgi:hypothetical protein